jgi:hypothetical protein
MKGSNTTSAEIVRHRLLEGVLLRLARLPDGERFVLRGGMLMRLWFRPHPRAAGDLDLVGVFPFSVEETARRFARLLADSDVDDGVTFDPERFRVEGIWLDTNFPGTRLLAAGEVGGIEDEFSVDVTFGEPLVPAPQPGEYPLLCGKQTARVWMCRPETITGRKLHALVQMGRLRWRPKDLNDLRLLLRRVPMNPSDLVEAIQASFTSRGNTNDDARAVLARDSWWTMKTSSVRWQQFVRGARGQDVSANLAEVVAEIRERLKPILERLP